MSRDALYWAFNFFYHRDKMNSAVHCVPVRFSEITYRVFYDLRETWPKDEDFSEEMAEVQASIS